MGTKRTPRVAIITMGQTPRPDVLPELRALLGDVCLDEFGALDGVSDAIIAKVAPRANELSFMTRLRDGRHVILEASFVTKRTEALVETVDDQGYDLLVLAMTGLQARPQTRTLLVHGQYALDAWISALTTGNSRIGIIYPLTSQRATFSVNDHATLLQSSHATIGGHHGTDLADAIGRVSGADLIIMNSIGYTAEMAQQVARPSGKPVVTACRIIGSTARLRLAEIAGKPLDLSARTYTGAELLKRLPPTGESLTRRESEVLVHALEGAANKFIGRALGISHRTVEIHRSRAMLKLGATSAAELIWCALTQPER